ncbi:hypothetical protein RFI_19896 [Reticulomyxa filosa]|uniref:Uncharacterized protein n=1 Tax=Reticulomyxa filosa TaxID=46433 RepID=X6MUW6_RETFI|nr:hypothetical protein RFI_19896 [Reticulomyxa filosa]|eukprot:ETO17426.1 hypothetical protein RFI_19896 [Reticulomyxa filosa]
MIKVFIYGIFDLTNKFKYLMSIRNMYMLLNIHHLILIQMQYVLDLMIIRFVFGIFDKIKMDCILSKEIKTKYSFKFFRLKKIEIETTSITMVDVLICVMVHKKVPIWIWGYTLHITKKKGKSVGVINCVYFKKREPDKQKILEKHFAVEFCDKD